MILQDLQKKNLIHPPSWLIDNCQYLTIMGSNAYGVSSDNSDNDIYGFCIPPKNVIFPHLAGEIANFIKESPNFDQWEQSHVLDTCGKKSYDFNVYNLVKYLLLVGQNNPNMVDSLYTPVYCVIHISKIGNMIREKRDTFLHKGCFHKFKGYAFSQISKASAVRKDKNIIAIRKMEEDLNISHEITFEESKIRENFPTLSDLEWKQYSSLFETGMNQTKRFASQKRFNTDVKFLYHLVRLVDECEQILTLGTMDLQRSKEHMKAVRRGEVSEEDLKTWFTGKENDLEKMYTESKLPYGPDWNKIKTLMLQCLEEHYGNLENCIVIPNAEKLALQEIKTILERYKI